MNLNYKEMWEAMRSWIVKQGNALPFSVGREFHVIEERAKEQEKKRIEELAKMEAELGLPEGHEESIPEH